jgi:transcriptional antiterminator NusG
MTPKDASMPGEENLEFQEHEAAPEGAEGQHAANPQEFIPAIPEPFEDEEERALDKSEDDPAEPFLDAPEETALLPESTKKWFILHTYSGFEEKVKESLITRGQAFGFSEQIGQILIPKEEVVELRNGKKITTKRLVYPGYVLVEMEMNDDLWHRVKETPRVTGFLGGGNVPTPLTADEVNQILYRQENQPKPRPKMTFEKNETVRIIDGPFTNFSGKIDEVNLERNTLRVLVTIFGRATPVELDFLQVEKT